MASYVVNWLTTGDGVWPLKLTNLVIHLLCGVLVFLLSNKLLAGPVASLGRGRPWVALWIAACWLLAPMLVSTMLYVTQRMAALTTLFSLAALLFYVHGREGIAENRARGLGLIAMGLGVFWPLAIASPALCTTRSREPTRPGPTATPGSCTHMRHGCSRRWGVRAMH